MDEFGAPFKTLKNFAATIPAAMKTLEGLSCTYNQAHIFPGGKFASTEGTMIPSDIWFTPSTDKQVSYFMLVFGNKNFTGFEYESSGSSKVSKIHPKLTEIWK